MRKHNKPLNSLKSLKDLISLKTFGEVPKIVYHGTPSRNYGILNNNVLIRKCKKRTDFGKGFYLTSNYEQASEHAKNRCREDDEPIVFHYEIDLEVLATLPGIYTFEKMDIEWAKFIFHNRSKKHFRPHDLACVYGGVADGQLDTLMKEMDKFAHIDDGAYGYFLSEIRKYASYDQLSVHNQEIFTQNIIQQVQVSKAFNENSTYKPKPNPKPKTPIK